MKLYETTLLHWIFIGRWYFKNLAERCTQDDLFTIWDNVKNTIPDNIVRRDVGRIIVNISYKFK